MEAYQSNAENLLDYLALFRMLAEDSPPAKQAAARLEQIFAREAVSAETGLAAPYLRVLCGLDLRAYLLVMAALALELDGGLRLQFRRQWGREIPDLEYGLHLLEPICPPDCAVLAEMLADDVLTGLLMRPEREQGFILERPLYLTRAAVGFLVNGSPGNAPWRTVLWPPEQPLLPLHAAAYARVCGWLQKKAGAMLLLCGPEGAGRRTLLRRAAAGDGTPVVCADLEMLAHLDRYEKESALRDITASAVLLRAPVCIEHGFPQETQRALARLCRRYRVPHAALCTKDDEPVPGAETVCLPESLPAAECAAVWRAFSGPCAYNPDAQAARYRLSAGTVQAIAAQAAREAQYAGRNMPREEDVSAAVQKQGGSVDFGIDYALTVTFQDLIVPDSVRQQLDLLCAMAENRTQLAAWGFPPEDMRGGVTAVFHGPSGTGKTMAAAVIAHRLGMPLLRADLAGLMDKYIGETEKHLERLFRSARERNCVLLFDEADALFGKRTEVESAHDKYANVSTSYLLQELERYEGVALLSTNLLQNFDEAFLRRLRFVIKFPLPDAALRETLWRRTFPDSARCAADFDPALLARAELSPARIRETARAAAVAAIAGGRDRVDLYTAACALRTELEKNGKRLPPEIAAALQAGG